MTPFNRRCPSQRDLAHLDLGNYSPSLFVAGVYMAPRSLQRLLRGLFFVISLCCPASAQEGAAYMPASSKPIPAGSKFLVSPMPRGSKRT